MIGYLPKHLGTVVYLHKRSLLGHLCLNESTVLSGSQGDTLFQIPRPGPHLNLSLPLSQAVAVFLCQMVFG